MKLVIASVDDRVTLAGVLVKNGYIVRQFKEKRPTGKSYNYGLNVTKPRKEMVESASGGES